MRRIIASLLIGCLLFLATVSAHALELDLYPMSRNDLEQFSNDINKAIKQYHTGLSSAEQNNVLSPVKTTVEEYIKGQNMTNPSWPWFDYSYSRQWDLLCVETRVDVKDADKKSHSFRVYG